MTLKDAIESGKPFKRSRHSVWMAVVGFLVRYDSEDGVETIYQPDAPDVIATDWEIKEDKPKLKAWILDPDCLKAIRFTSADHYKQHAIVFAENQPANSTRAPWLDEPGDE